MPKLLSIAEARAAVAAAVAPLETETVPVATALGRVLAEPVAAGGDVPPFPNSAMDGFAVRSGPAGRTLRIVGESRAGAPVDGALADGEAGRTSAGGGGPEGADGVLQLELAEEDPAAGTVTTGDAVAPGRNVRAAGSDVEAGTTLPRPGPHLAPAQLGVAVSAGLARLPVGAVPTVAVLTTGDELRPPGAEL